MAKLPDISRVASEVRAALDERRIPDAKRIAAKALRAGHHHQEFLNIVAEMLEVKKQSGKLGRKRQTSPRYWLEIGIDFEKLRDVGVSYEKACEELERKWGTKNTIQKAVAFFRKAKKEHDEIS
jgi:hypothetical protein